MALKSIALRLALGLSMGTAILWLGAAAISGLVMRHELQTAFDETLRQSALRLLPLAVHDLREPDEADEREVLGLGGRDEHFTWYVLNRAGAVVMRGEDAQAAMPRFALTDGFSEAHGKRIFAKRDPPSGYAIVVMENTERRRKALDESLGALILPLAGLLPLIGFAIWYAVRLAMRPVERLRQDIAERGGQNFTPLKVDDHPTELAPIAQAVADLLLRLQAALKAERAFAASSAHELRTPLAGALAQTQQLALEMGAAPGAKRLAEIERSLKHLSQLAEKLLQLSRVEAGIARTSVVSDLIPAARLVTRDFQALPAMRRRVPLHMAEGARLDLPLDVDAFAIVLRNVIENALIHGAADGRVDVYVGADKRISVRNEGSIVPAAILADLGRPFLRGDTAASGSGLGLSIVRMILQQAGGQLILTSPPVGQLDGFEATLDFSGLG